MTHLIWLFIVMLIVEVPSGWAQDTDSTIRTLPSPNTTGGMPLMNALSARHSTREFDSRDLSDQTLSDLLWAAFGINRPESGKRTAPSAMNWQEIDIYVALKDGLYLYQAKSHALKRLQDRDIRPHTGNQSFVADAPVNLIYVADTSRMGGVPEEKQIRYGAADTGFISQNVYLFCASEKLATVVRGAVDYDTLREVMDLVPDQRIILTQTVGYPAP
jgi:SagB-type dehydrogenase family enzyme